jgi:DNA-binding LytR/AlgR family response regulator
MNRLKPFSDKKFICDFPLDELELSLDPRLFFRVNRQCIMNVNAIESIHLFPGGSLKVKARPQPEGDIIIARRRVPAFRGWMNS